MSLGELRGSQFLLVSTLDGYCIGHKYNIVFVTLVRELEVDCSVWRLVRCFVRVRRAIN